MPASQEEWEAHWAFYKLTVLQRDAAWSEVTNLRQLLERLGPRLLFSDPPDHAHPERQDPSGAHHDAQPPDRAVHVRRARWA